MAQMSSAIEKSGGRRLALYAELGSYFTAEGVLNETAFRSLLKSRLTELSSGKSAKEIKDEQGAWLSRYITEVLDYLTEKHMTHAAAQLFSVAADEAARAGFDSLTVAPDQLRNIIQMTAGTVPEKTERRSSADDKKRKIYKAALKIFSEEGYHLATMEKIASLSGVAKGTVYTYFKSKEELLDQLLEEYYQQIVDKISAICSGDIDILEQARQLIEFWVHFIETNPLVYRLIQSEAIFQRNGNKVMFYDYIISQLPMFKERIVSKNREHQLKTTSFYTTFYGILGFIDGVAQKWFRSQMEYSLSEEIPVILEVLFNGFVGEQNTRRQFFSAEDS